MEIAPDIGEEIIEKLHELNRIIAERMKELKELREYKRQKEKKEKME